MSNSASVSRASSYSPAESLDYTHLQLAVLKGSLDEARFALTNNFVPNLLLRNFKVSP